MDQSTQPVAPKVGAGPELTALVSEGQALRDRIRSVAGGHAYVADDLADLADELDDILFRLAGLTTRRP